VPDEVGPRGWPAGFADSDARRRDLLVLASLQGIRPIEVHALAWREGTADAILARVRAGEAGSVADRRFAEQLDPAAILGALRACGARLIGPDDPEYPRALDDLRDPPAALFARGMPIDPVELRVGVVGARSASHLGIEVAHDIGRGLALAGACVVSGAARGIDSASHRGALGANGSTIAVLGSGIDVFYPASSADLLARIARTATVLSEYPPGVRAEPHRFPARNRIVVGLSRALVVVEGAERSGSMISVGHALAIGREVFAVPGPVSSPLAEVPLRLIREGATMIRGAADLLADLGFDPQVAATGAVQRLTDRDRRVLETMSGPSLPEHLAAQLGVEIPDVVVALMRMEMVGLVRNVGGRYEATIAVSRALESAPEEDGRSATTATGQLEPSGGR
jgi:DNA processing protein